MAGNRKKKTFPTRTSVRRHGLQQKTKTTVPEKRTTWRENEMIGARSGLAAPGGKPKHGRVSSVDPEELESGVRKAYFAVAAWVALRYDVELDDVITHMRTAGVHSATRPGAAIQYVEDIVLAVAATQGKSQAWQDIAQVFDLTLVRACSLRLDEHESVIYVRRFLGKLQQETTEDFAVTGTRPTIDAVDDEIFDDEPLEGDGGLRAYAGLRPLRVWLTDRLLAQLEQEVPALRVRLEPACTGADLRLADCDA